MVECPFCKKIGKYETKANIPMNFAMLDIIRLWENSAVQISISVDRDLDKASQIEALIGKIQAE